MQIASNCITCMMLLNYGKLYPIRFYCKLTSMTAEIYSRLIYFPASRAAQREKCILHLISNAIYGALRTNALQFELFSVKCVSWSASLFLGIAYKIYKILCIHAEIGPKFTKESSITTIEPNIKE